MGDEPVKLMACIAALLGLANSAQAQERASVAPKNMQAIAPALADYTDDVLFGDVWRRPGLAPRDRSLVTIAALAANGDEDQLGFHIQRGMENGLTREEIAEALTHLAFYAGWPKATNAVAAAGKAFAAGTLDANAADASAGPRLQVVGPGARPALGPASNFTGSVTVSSPFKGTGDARLGGATVTFQPGAHSNWHTHPLGQLLVISPGRGWVQAEGEPVRAVGPGDVVWTAPGVKHWHGATRSSAMTHVAIAEAQDGIVVRWLEPVTDAQYQGPE